MIDIISLFSIISSADYTPSNLIQDKLRSRITVTLRIILSPTYFDPDLRFLFSNHDRNIHSINNLLFLCPSNDSDFLDASFFVRAVLLWNAFPLDIWMSLKRACTITSFTRRNN